MLPSMPPSMPPRSCAVVRRTSLAVLPLVVAAGLAERTAIADRFDADWRRTPDRIWVGPEYRANRLQDWRVADGTVECVAAAPRQPVRTLMLLTHAVPTEGAGAVSMRVLLDPRGTQDGAPPAEAFAGFLIGAGHDGDDHRRSALVHHRPAPDGGLLVVVEPTGRLAIRDFSRGSGGGFQWSLGGATEGDAMPELVVDRGDVADPTAPLGGWVRLELDLAPGPTGWRLDARVVEAEEERVLSTATLADLPTAMIDGLVGLVSHRTRARFDGWQAAGTGFVQHPDRAFGPVMGLLYTVDEADDTPGRTAAGEPVDPVDTWRLTAQFPPLGEADARRATLEIQPRQGDFWQTLETVEIDPLSWTAHFENPLPRSIFQGGTRAIPYRVVWSQERTDGTRKAYAARGLVRPSPGRDEPLSIGSLSCHKAFTGGLRWNSDGLWWPHEDLVARVAAQDPDLLYFAGDQIYEGDLTPGGHPTPEQTLLDYLDKFTRYLWAFGELSAVRPAVMVPDDHDVWHGNLWGAGGRRARATEVAGEKLTVQDSGGYKLPPRIVNAIHRTQVAHLPAPRIEGPIGEGYSVYTTSLDWGGVSFAILADRQFKESASVALPAARIRNGWVTAEGVDPWTDLRAPGVPFLGDAQEAFLTEWIHEWDRDDWMKVVLSQSSFLCAQTLPPGRGGGSQPGLEVYAAGEYAPDDVPCVDTDSNGWPVVARERAVATMSAAHVVHLTGDQHLGFAARYGVHGFDDGALTLASPAIANTWPRRWMPAADVPHRMDDGTGPLGRFRDGFGNRFTMLAVSNPIDLGREPAPLFQRSPGWARLVLDPVERAIVAESWMRFDDPVAASPASPGFRVHLEQADLLGGEWSIPLARVESDGRAAVATVARVDGSTIATFPLDEHAPSWLARAPESGRYRIRLLDRTGTLLRERWIDTEMPVDEIPVVRARD